MDFNKVYGMKLALCQNMFDYGWDTCVSVPIQATSLAQCRKHEKKIVSIPITPSVKYDKICSLSKLQPILTALNAFFKMFYQAKS